MKAPYDKGLASHIGTESCGGGGNAAAEALTGVRADLVLSREILFEYLARIDKKLNSLRDSRHSSKTS